MGRRYRMSSRVKKSNKKILESINSKLQLVMKSGKYTLGYQSSLKSLRSGKSKLIIISNNCPPVYKSELQYYAMLSRTRVYYFAGNNVELGTVCGKYFCVSSLSILEPGESDIIAQND